MSKQYSQNGAAADVEFGKAGPRFRQNGAGRFQARDTDNAVFVNVQGLDASVDDDLVTYRQLQAGLNGLSWKQEVDLATTAALSPTNTITGAGATLTATAVGAVTIDGVAVVLGTEFLVKNEVDLTKNGVYVCTTAGAVGVAYIMTRRADMAVGDDAASDAMFAQGGSVNADSAFTCTNNTPDAVVGTDLLVFVNFASVVGGVTSVATAAGVTGVTVLDDGSPAVPTMRGILGASGELTATLSGTNIVVSIDANAITTGFIAAEAVTEAKIAPLAGFFTRRLLFTFADAGSTLNVGALLPANAVVIKNQVKITTAFDIDMDMSLGVPLSPALLMRTADIASLKADLYLVETSEDGAAGLQLQLDCIASLASVGAGYVEVMFLKSA